MHYSCRYGHGLLFCLLQHKAMALSSCILILLVMVYDWELCEYSTTARGAISVMMDPLIWQKPTWPAVKRAMVGPFGSQSNTGKLE